MNRSGDLAARIWSPVMAAIMLPAVVVVGGGVYLVGGSMLSAVFGGCEDSGERLGRISAPSLLPAPYPGAVLLDDHEDAGSGCFDDSSGDASVAVTRVYRFDGEGEAAAAHHLRAAEKSGWEGGDDREPGGPASLCFTRETAGTHVMLSMRFGSSTYDVLVESALDGSPMEC